MKRFSLLILVLLVWTAHTVHAADIRVWDFDHDLEGWTPVNWESAVVKDGAFAGVSKYDCQLLSPELNICAADYPELIVRLRSDMSAAGEVFFNAPGEGMSDAKKIVHSVMGSRDYVVYRIPLSANPKWTGTINRIRFDPLNPAGAHIAIDFIALMPQAGMMLVNGGAEILEQGRPFEWTGGPDAGRAAVTDQNACSGSHALQATDGGWWETADIDLSFLGTFKVTGQVRTVKGKPPAVSVRFFKLNGEELPGITHNLPCTDRWTPFAFTFDSPRRAATARLRFAASQGGAVAEFDDIQATQESRGYILTPQTPGPTWTAQWIWHPEAMKREHIHAYFRRAFDLPAKPVRTAKLQITADDGYGLFVNGKFAGKTFGEMDGWRTPEVIDLKPFLHSGKNLIAVDVENITSAAGLIAELAVVFTDGSEQWLRTDGAWQTDLTAETNWNTTAETRGSWRSAAVIGTPPCQPWGQLPYRFLGVPAQVELKLGPLPKRVKAPAALNLTVRALARTGVRHPVYVAAVVERNGKELRREWSREPLFADPAKAGVTARITDWRIPLPYGIPSGPVRVHLELVAGEIVGKVPATMVSVTGQNLPHQFPTARIERRDGLSRFYVNGVEVDPSEALFNSPEPLHLRNAATTGVPIWSVALDDMGFTDHGFDYTKIDEALSRYLEADPHAWLLPTFTLDTRYQPAWIKAHPEARCRLEDGNDIIGDYAGGRRMVPSYGSSVWRDTYTDALRRLIRHLKNSPFASRIIGFQPCMGISWEWFHWGSQSNELVDYSAAGEEDFRRWLKDKYGTDATLQAAWHDPQITLRTAKVPSGERRRHSAHGMFFDPETQQDVIDYNRYEHDVVADSIIHFAHVIKEETGGRSIVGTYYGYVMHLPETAGFDQGSGHFSLTRLLASPDVDYTMAPIAYAWREVGGTAACMTTADSLTANGKLFWTQADLRTHWSDQDHGRPATLWGSVQVMRRTEAAALATGTAVQWYDFTNGWIFGDERLTDELERLKRIDDTRAHARDWDRSKYLAVIVDDQQMGTFDPFHPPYGLGLIYRQREQLLRSGVPWRAYLFSDLMKHPELLQHRAFLFLNLFRLTAAQREFLRTKVMTEGRTVAFVGPVGLMDENGFSAQHTSDLLGWNMAEVMTPTQLLTKFAADLPEPWRACSGMDIGVSPEFAPIVLPATAAGTVLATLGKDHRPAILFEKKPAVNLLWSAVPGFPPEMLRGIAAVAGLPIACTSNDAVYIGHGYVGIHASSEGTKTIRLPQPAAVTELITGKTWPAGTREVKLDLKAGETAILLCR